MNDTSRRALRAARTALALLLALACLTPAALAKKTPKKDAEAAAEKKKDEGPWAASSFAGLAFRNIGPAITSGRIVDLAVNPRDHDQWIVASASGGTKRLTHTAWFWPRATAKGPVKGGRASGYQPAGWVGRTACTRCKPPQVCP